jgi:eukaryotic-like serine/threonine-protein kinase
MPATEARIALPSRYRVVRHIANGGMATVWAAEDELLGRLVAVKVLSPAYAADERANRRFLREARAGAKLSDCRHVVTVYDIGEHEHQPFMVMEHFAGGTLADRLRRGMAIPRALALRWLREAASALDCAHEHDVVHRDVKPANLLLDQRGRLAVGDFGIATVATETSVTQTGQVLGTAAYISPEQARGEAATYASDRYALAVVAFELLTGRRPFPGEHPAAQARAHVEASVPSASAVGDLPADVDDVLQAGMAKDQRRRPASAGDLVEALEDALAADDGEDERFTVPTRPTVPVARQPVRGAVAAGSSRPPTTGRAAAIRTPAPRRRWPAVGAALALVFVAAAAIAIAAGTGGNARRPSTSAATHRTASASRATKAAAPKAKPKSQPAPATTQQAAAQTGDDPVALNDQGFQLIRQQRSADAVPLLQRSVDAFRAQGATGRIDYAYALYNLGNALRLTGHPDQAIPFLQERLQVSNYKRGIVRRELALAQQQSGQGAAPGAGGGSD